MIHASAPGKVVLWGEYAVLTGAPALVLAVNRSAHCRLRPGGDDWHFRARGFAAPEARVSRERLLGHQPPAADTVWFTTWHVLQSLDTAALPEGGAVELDTSGFHHGGEKLGLGGSAAVCVAAYGAFCRLLGHTPDFHTALAIHRQLQGGRGSGIDVAAAWHGGTLRFQRQPDTGAVTADPWPLPSQVHLGFVWAGAPARTVDHLDRFRRWRERGDDHPLLLLAERCQALFHTANLLDTLETYVEALRGMDDAAGLGIYSEAHRRLHQLAIDAGVVYKPCGAGGGDLGASFAADAEATGRFSRLAADNGFLPLPLETTPDGLEITG